MFFPLIPAGIAALGAAGRAVNSPTGQRIIQGGINTMQPYMNTLSNFIGRQMGTTPVTSTGTLSGLSAAALPTFTASYLSEPSTAVQTAGEDLKFFGYDLPKSGTDLIVEQIEKLLKKEDPNAKVGAWLSGKDGWEIVDIGVGDAIIGKTRTNNKDFILLPIQIPSKLSKWAEEEK